MKPTYFPNTTCPDLSGNTNPTKSRSCGFSRHGGTGYHPIKINFIMMKRNYYVYILAVMLFSCEKPIYEFQSHNFIKYFGSGYESKGNDVIEISDASYVLTGYDKVNGFDYQVFAAKVDKNGNMI